MTERYFFSRDEIPGIITSGSSAFTLQSTKPFRDKTIPFSHIYITPEVYYDKISRSLSAAQKIELQNLSLEGQKSIEQHPRFPKDLSALNINSVREFHAEIDGKSHIHIVIVNGLGNTITSHKQGILNLQRLARLLAPVSVQFHIMQANNEKFSAHYEGLSNIFIYNNCMAVSQFFNADFYINITEQEAGKTVDFNKLPLATRFLRTSKLKPKAKKITKIAVIIPHFGSQAKLNDCLDALLNVKLFDPRWLYIVDNNSHNRYFTLGVNHGIQQAIEDDCDYFWLLNNDTQPYTDYLNATLKRFNTNKKVGIVGGKNLVTERPDRIFWGGSHQAFPNGVHKAGYVSRGSLNEATQESWATFSSVVIRRQTLDDCGLLDGTMRMIFSDSDYCFQAGLKGWQVWYEPTAVILHDTGVSRNAPNQAIITIFRQDKREFYWKWSKLTGCEEPEKLQDAIFNKIGFEP